MSALQTFLRNGGKIEDLQAQFAIKTTRHRRYPHLVLFKYNQIESPFAEPVVRSARGCILDESDGWRHVYVLDGPKGPVVTGDLRIDPHAPSGRAAVSLTVHPGARQAGYGAVLLALLLQEARRLRYMSYAAFIKPGNAASIRLFGAAGFRPVHFWPQDGLLEFHK